MEPPYTSLKQAVEAATGDADAKTGDITLVADVSSTEKISITKDVTIVGNGKDHRRQNGQHGGLF